MVMRSVFFCNYVNFIVFHNEKGGMLFCACKGAWLLGPCSVEGQCLVIWGGDISATANVTVFYLKDLLKLHR